MTYRRLTLQISKAGRTLRIPQTELRGTVGLDISIDISVVAQYDVTRSLT